MIPYPPIVSVASVTYADAAGEDQVMDPAAYRLGTHGLAPVYGTSWPTARLDDDPIRIRYQAGWPMSEGDSPVWTGPPGIKVAILMMVGDLFENRESQVIVDSRAVQFSNPNADLLLAPWKVWA